MEKRKASIGDALREINSDIKYTYLGDEYETLKILSDHEKPTKEAIESARVPAQKRIDDTYYQIQRKENYPPIVDQLDKIYHNGIDEWKKVIKAVKDTYPKP